MDSVTQNTIVLTTYFSGNLKKIQSNSLHWGLYGTERLWKERQPGARYAVGRVTVTVVPWPGWLSSSIVPPLS
jgi:hypothetical protein